MLLQARKIDLLPGTQPSSSSPSQVVSSALFEPSSSSLAVMLSDSSFLLYPSFSPFSPSPTARAAPTPVPPLSSAACFLRLKTCPNPDPGRILFLSASPGSSSILLRSWILLRRSPAADLFAPARLSFKKDFDKTALSLPLPHGISVRLAVSVNFMVLHSIAANQIWVMAARLVREEGSERESIRLTKCAVVDCTLPIYSVGVSTGFLLLGEVGGVRVFPLRPLIKGRAVKQRRVGRSGVNASAWSGSLSVDLCKKNVLNGMLIHVNRGKNGVPYDASGEELHGPGARCCGVEDVGDKKVVNGKIDANQSSYKPRTVKLTQTSGVHCSFFVELMSAEFQSSEGRTKAFASVKAVSFHALSQKKFLILDSAGGLHFLNLHNTSEATTHSLTSGDACVNRLTCTMKVQMLAVLPDVSTRSQVIWISDGGFSVHMMPAADLESTITENEKSENGQKEIQISAIQAIFTSDMDRCNPIQHTWGLRKKAWLKGAASAFMKLATSNLKIKLVIKSFVDGSSIHPQYIDIRDESQD